MRVRSGTREPADEGDETVSEQQWSDWQSIEVTSLSNAEITELLMSFSPLATAVMAEQRGQRLGDPVGAAGRFAAALADEVTRRYTAVVQVS